MGNGKLDPKAVALYKSTGAWLKVNGESIYNTRRNPLLMKPEWGDISVSKDGKSLYLHVLKWEEGDIKLQGLKEKVTTAQFLNNKEAVTFHTKDGVLFLNLPTEAPDPVNSVIKLTLENSISE